MRKRLFYWYIILCPFVLSTAQTPQGVFSVSATKTVQFKAQNEPAAATSDLIRWSSTFATTDGNGWRVLTNDEWTYLLVTRDPDANALGRVDGTNGLIILPDDWQQPSSAPAYTPVDAGVSFELNIYTAAEWAVMESAGAVFLPCGGYGYDNGGGYTVEDQSDHGAYWAADESGTDRAYCMRFNEEQIHDLNNALKTNYYSVRMVREVTVLSEEDEQAAFESKFSTAKQEDFALVRRTLYKDGYFNTLCLPFDVQDIQASPLADAEVYSFISGSVADGVLLLDIAPITTNRLEHGVPYLIRWATGDDLSFLAFDDVTWDDDTTPESDSGGNNVKCHGFYPKTHLTDATDGADEHYNLFLGADDELYWPTDGDDPDAKMSGFRAHFYIVSGGSPSATPLRKGMPAALRRTAQTTTDLQTQQGADEQKALNTPEKVIQDGQVVLRLNGQTYTITGQLINQPQ